MESLNSYINVKILECASPKMKLYLNIMNLLSSKYMNGNKNIINISHQLIDCVPTEALTVKNDINEVILKTYNLYHANENLYKLITNIDTIKKYIKINLNAVNHNRKDIINKIK